MDVGVVWFKRDLRTHDHHALVEAAERCGGVVVGLYIYEPIVLDAEEHDDRHLAFVNECLVELREALRTRGSELLLARGDAVTVLQRLRRMIDFTHLFSHEETGLGATYQRDIDVKAWAQASGVEWIELPQHGVVRPLRSRNGWARKWNARMRGPAVNAPASIAPVDAARLDAFGRGALLQPESRVSESIQRGGARRGMDLLESFLHQRGKHYQREVSSPLEGADACSRLSPHFAYGSMSLRAALHAAVARRASFGASRSREASAWKRSIASFEKRLRWHCHFMQKLEDEPEIEGRNFNRAYDGLRTEDDAEWSNVERARYDSFVNATTGYPFVDACLRSLQETGWINFRMRAMLMSFSSYHLWLHWKKPAIHLARLFTDFEPGIHYSQCQMQSGVTGINTVRIYSPIKQQTDQDPEGVFVRRWLPELSEVPNEFLHRPQDMPEMTQRMAGCVIGSDYPAPIVEHKAAYAEAKRRVFERKGSAAARAEARRVYTRHGSRKRPTMRTERRG
jgi:deoxyribodipyrimidine photo-lyase